MEKNSTKFYWKSWINGKDLVNSHFTLHVVLEAYQFGNWTYELSKDNVRSTSNSLVLILNTGINEFPPELSVFHYFEKTTQHQIKVTVLDVNDNIVYTKIVN